MNKDESPLSDDSRNISDDSDMSPDEGISESGESGESGESSSSEDDSGSRANCIRNRSNFSHVKSMHMMDKKDFNPDMLQIYIENNAAPKLKLLLKKIKSLDAKDMKERGKHFKHMIFTDVNRSAYGAKIIASALSAYGMNMIYHPQGTGFSMYSDSKLLETRGNNFVAVLSKSFYDRPINAKFRKSIWEKFNSRPDNVYGDLCRFIILDQGFKEGIDLFDVKYVHLFEPLVVAADEKQAIGRGTRFCGQKGLEFHPTYGWPLYVFKYDLDIPVEYRKYYNDSKTLFELYIKNSNLDMRKIIFANELEKAGIAAAVDADLTRNIHTFAIEKPALMFSNSRNNSSQSSQSSESPEASPVASPEASPVASPVASQANTGGGKKKMQDNYKRKYDDTRVPSKLMNIQNMRAFISSKYRRGMSYPRVKLENECRGGSNGNLVNFTPTQDFVRHYFQPASAYKGLLLHHSVGTGKTCTAIATATTSFDVEGYTILWVTRHTLKNDIWKNMFGQVCSLDVQEKIKDGLVLPNKITKKTSYISQNWMDPISYKQFSNMLLKRNKIYNEMVRRNGEEDPLRKTLLIVDEAHKLYSPTVAQSEKPNTDILEKMIQNSYDKSGKDSVRVLLMTATPFTADGMEMIKLLNLLRQGQQLPIDFNQFADTYLDDGGYFTKSGLQRFQDNISGYISYLNKSQYANQFAHPVIQNVYADMSIEPVPEDKNVSTSAKISKETREHMKEVRAEIRQIKAMQKAAKKAFNGTAKTKECLDRVKGEFEGKTKEAKNTKEQEETRCKELPVKQRKGCKDEATQKYKQLMEDLKQQKAVAMDECRKLKNAIANDNEELQNAMAKLEGLTKEVAEFKIRAAKVRERNAQKKVYRLEVRELNARRKPLQEKIKTTRAELKEKRAELKEKRKQLKSITDKIERKKATREFRKSEPLIPEVKNLNKTMKDLRAQSSRFNSEANVIKLKHGLKKIKNISQQYALAKYCKV